MTAFALVHGAWEGAWIWERLTPELEARGHRVVAMDLPCEDGTATFEAYAEVVVRAVEAEALEEVVVVGHSLAGLTIPLVAARRAVSRLIYLCALVPIPGRSLVEQLGIEPDTLRPGYEAGLSEPDAQSRTRWVDEGLARDVVYADCDEGEARAASSRARVCMQPEGCTKAMRSIGAITDITCTRRPAVPAPFPGPLLLRCPAQEARGV